MLPHASEPFYFIHWAIKKSTFSEVGQAVGFRSTEFHWRIPRKLLRNAEHHGLVAAFPALGFVPEEGEFDLDRLGMFFHRQIGKP